jgi:hypothetical protein
MVCSQGIEFRHFLVIKVKPPGLVAHDTSVRSIFYPGNDNLIQGTFEGFTLQGHIFVHNTPHLIALGAASGGHGELSNKARATNTCKYYSLGHTNAQEIYALTPFMVVRLNPEQKRLHIQQGK